MKNITEHLYSISNISDSINISLIDESKEDGKYISFPKTVYKPYNIPASIAKHMPADRLESAKEAYKKELENYKAYKKEVKRISGENFKIVLDKIKKEITSGNAKLNIDVNSKSAEYHIKNFKDVIDNAYMAINSKRYIVKDYTNDLNRKNPVDAYMKNIVLLINDIARFYKIDCPSWDQYDDDFIDTYAYLSPGEVDQRSNKYRNDEQYHKFANKLLDKYDKNAPKMEKFREKFKKTEEYKDIIDILDYCENDLKKIDNAYEKWSNRFEQNTKYKDAYEHVKSMYEKEIKKVFYDTNVYVYTGKSSNPDLMTALIITYARTGEIPEVNVVNKSTSSWLAGMKTTCNFEVIGTDGNKILTGRYEDHGLSGDGFGPYD